MKTIYVLSQGEYSDYRVVGVFSDQALAETVKPLYPDSQIEEFPLDHVPEHPPGHLWYYLQIDRNGNTRDSRQENPPSSPDSKMPQTFDPAWRRTSCWARDLQHAAKIANERRTALLARGAWEDPELE